ncbi:MAG: hypothetical protein EA340_09545 [Nitriliruptor sp.]|nr:MAG: hypothetical protein EA340_09545 [Nitriliruptor sp.]
MASLADTSLPCPRCETPLDADKLVGGASPARRPPRRQASPAAPVAPVAPAAPAARAAASAAAATGDTPPAAATGDEGVAGTDASIRPPDLDPREVQAPGDDVLAGWDVGVTPAEIDSWRADRRPFPADAVAVAAGAVLGSVLGVAVTERRRVLGAALGGLGGIAAVGAVRRLWELPG